MSHFSNFATILSGLLMSLATFSNFDYALSKLCRVHRAIFPNVTPEFTLLTWTTWLGPAYVSNRNSGRVWRDGKTDSRNQTNRNPSPRGVGVSMFPRKKHLAARRGTSTIVVALLPFCFSSRRRNPREVAPTMRFCSRPYYLSPENYIPTRR